MKYGMRERISGAVILIALAVIFVPMLFDEPAPRDERPQPVLTIEQPVPVERRDVPEPQPPASLGQTEAPGTALQEPGADAETVQPIPEVAPMFARPEREAEPDVAAREPVPAEPEAPASEPPAEDPIADLARAASERLDRQGATDSAPAESAPTPTAAAPSGEWAVQVGSFGEVSNAERLEAQLIDQGFSAYSRLRDNNLTTVYVGPYESSDAGERAMAELKEEANLQGLLVRVRE
ncbi:acetyl-CoA carboxylase subunit beta [Halomonas campisalis]|uniref:Acetyl-CoA carboxylase subunit beta n=1 Tax=Billgrantia campisalis TaxID=74661 RepID=A0ABS9P4F8_9GAMM|nr:SPOR domain-containing protein [Halomonas campisalis]MCG6656294.1 acetyl-CoA carboxylase subunit beta [Halomonas campisalis]MDR5861481.1 SPOR domain-containing protein [Halomonas campisalis]